MKQPTRYLLTWREANDFKWHEFQMKRKPRRMGWVCPHRFEDLETGEVLASNFDLRHEAYFATHDWPKRKKLLAAWKKFLTPKPKPSPDERAAQRRLKRFHNLLARQKTWLTKARRVRTELRKIHAALRRIEPIAIEKP